MSNLNTFQAQMQAQRDAYAHDLPRRLSDIQTLWGQAIAGRAESLREMNGLVHKLRGSAGMYGFGNVSETAGLLDVALSSFFGSEQDLGTWRAQLGALVEALARSAEGPQDDLPELELPSAYADDKYDQSLVLVVDDEQPVRDAIRFYLEQVGFRLVCASDGAEAVKLASETTPDIILMDIQMPNMTGLQATKLLYENPSLKDVPVVFLTAEDDTDTVLKALSYSSEGYLLKPVEMETIANKLMTVLAATA
ncbi:MAG: response regulator [Bacteroidota bacterium]